MPTTGLRGPYKLDNDTIDKVVTLTSEGAYVLGRLNKEGEFVTKYVGRADKDVNERLKKRVGKGYSYFKFAYCSSPKAAFEKECNLYHYWKKQLDNVYHPDRPIGTNWQCPQCDKFKKKKP